jgi:PAS domain-containing protein
MVNKKGHAIDILMSAAITDEPLRQGQVSLAVLTDITALSRTERLLAESEARCRNFVEEQRDLVALVSPEGKLEFANRAYDATIESAAFTIPCCPLGRSPSRR